MASRPVGDPRRVAFTCVPKPWCASQMCLTLSWTGSKRLRVVEAPYSSLHMSWPIRGSAVLVS